MVFGLLYPKSFVKTTSCQFALSGFSRPRHLLVFINPFGGKRRAPKVFEKVLPYFELAGITTDVIGKCFCTL